MLGLCIHIYVMVLPNKLHPFFESLVVVCTLGVTLNNVHILKYTQVTEVGGFCEIYRCHDAEQKVDERDRHPMGSKDYHPLQAVCSFSESSREH